MALVGHWKLDGNALDSSGNGNHGEPNNVTTTYGILGQCYLFSGNGDVRLPADNLKKVHSITCSLWCRTELVVAEHKTLLLVGRDISSGYEIYSYNNAVYVGIWGNLGKAIASTPITVQEWHHVLFTYESGIGGGFYIDGNKVASIPDKGQIIYPAMYGTAPTIGSHGGLYFFEGRIDDVRIYDHVLSQKEIKELAKAKLLHYKFDNFAEYTENLWVTDLRLPSDILVEDTSTTSLIQPFYTFTTITPSNAGDNLTLSFDYHIISNDSYNIVMYFEFQKWLQGSFVGGLGSAHLYYSEGATGRKVVTVTVPENDGTWDILKIKYCTAIKSDGVNYTSKICTVQLNNIQIEKKDHATPFVDGIRQDNVTDCSGQDNHAQLDANTPMWTSNSKIGSGCYEFDGSSQYIVAPYSKISSYSVVGWFKSNITLSTSTSSGSRRTIFKGDGQWNPGMWLTFGVIRAHAATKYTDVIWTGDTNWHQIGQVYDANTNNLYVVLDGQLLTGSETSYSPGDPTQIIIGNESIGGTTYPWNGLIDDVRIYSKALSDSEIQEIYQQRASIDDKGNFYSCGVKEPFIFKENWKEFPYSTYTLTINDNSTNYLSITSTSGDPMINMYNIGIFNPNKYKYVHIKYRVLSGTAGNVELFFTNEQYPTANGANHVSGGLVSDGNWHVKVLDMSTNANWTYSDVYGWRFDPCTNTGVTMEVEYISLSDRLDTFPNLDSSGIYMSENYSELGPTSGLSAYYPLNGDAKDYSGNANHGTVNGAVVSSGLGQSCYEFVSAEYDDIRIPHSPANTLSTEITAMAWIYPTGDPTDSRGTIVTKNTSYYLQHYIDNRIAVYTYWDNSGANGGSSYFYSTNTVVRNAWNFVVFTEDVDGFRSIYLDGNLDNSGQFESTIFQSTDDLGIGSQFNSRFFNGKIQNVRIYNRALTPEEIKILYNITNPNTEQRIIQSNTGIVYTKGQIKETL